VCVCNVCVLSSFFEIFKSGDARLGVALQGQQILQTRVLEGRGHRTEPAARHVTVAGQEPFYNDTFTRDTNKVVLSVEEEGPGFVSDATEDDAGHLVVEFNHIVGDELRLLVETVKRVVLPEHGGVVRHQIKGCNENLACGSHHPLCLQIFTVAITNAKETWYPGRGGDNDRGDIVAATTTLTHL